MFVPIVKTWSYGNILVLLGFAVEIRDSLYIYLDLLSIR